MRELLLSAALLALPAAAGARTVAAADVAVTLGPRMRAHAAFYGAAELAPLEQDLRDAVAVRAARAGFTHLELVLDDAVPNRPTVAMRSRNANFALSSLSRGGAKVSGGAYSKGGGQPLRFSWWAADLRDSAGDGVWTTPSAPSNSWEPTWAATTSRTATPAVRRLPGRRAGCCWIATVPDGRA